MIRGFTLMEVLVASLILSIGATALGSLYANFNSLRRQEIRAVDAYACSVSVMEKLLQTPPACGEPRTLDMVGDTARPCKDVPVRLTPVPGMSRLVVVSIPVSHVGKFQRIMKCR